jgi:CDP-glycerol glycerophosphotransferase
VKAMNQYFELSIIFIARIILKLFYIFPIEKRKVIFISYAGRQFSCNPKYIFEYILDHYGDANRYIWCLNNYSLLPDKYKIKHVKTVSYLSLRYIYHIMTAGCIIQNNPPEPIFPLRKKQIFVNAFHGGGAYKIGSILVKKREYSLKVKRNIRGRMTNYVISSCEKFSSIFPSIFSVSHSKFLSIGMPRNDIFFKDISEIRKKVIDYYHLNENYKVVLYAPTYRGDHRSPDYFYAYLNIDELLQGLKKRFGHDFIVMYRGHHDYKMDEFADIISATEYPDMQELLCAADILITDYSSCMWDFSFTHKPCFLYTPDLEKYRKECGFWTQPEEWPFSIAQTNNELIENILSFDNDSYITKVEKHHQDLGSYESGDAAEKLCNYLFPKT